LQRRKFQCQKDKRIFFISAEPDSNKIAFEDLTKVESVIEIYSSRRAYDFIAKVGGESLEYLREIISKEIKNLDSIKSTLTLVV